MSGRVQPPPLDTLGAPPARAPPGRQRRTCQSAQSGLTTLPRPPIVRHRRSREFSGCRPSLSRLGPSSAAHRPGGTELGQVWADFDGNTFG